MPCCTRQRSALPESQCRAYRFRTHIVYCEVPAAEQRRRNRARPDADVVPAAAMLRMLRRWTVPTPDEAHRVTYVVDAGAGPAWPPRPPPAEVSSAPAAST